MIEHANPRVHPAVHVALEGDHHFLRAEGVRHLHALDRLALVELLVRLRQAVHVVQRVVAVDDLQRLPDLDAEHVRRVVAPLLIEDDRLRRRREGAVAETVLHIHEHVADRAVAATTFVSVVRPGLAFWQYGSELELDWLRRRRSPFERHLAATVAAVAGSTAAGAGAADVAPGCDDC
jgi:hypothetical protein